VKGVRYEPMKREKVRESDDAQALQNPLEFEGV
jgi:hypothetical protein